MHDPPPPIALPVRRLLALALALPIGLAVADGSLLQPLGAGPVPAAPWHVVGLPKQTKPFTRFEVVELDGRRVLRVESDSSYGNLVHPLQFETPPASLQFGWRWRVDQLVEAADLRQRSGDDMPVKVCVFFDEPMANVPFIERQALRLARVRADEWLPSATVCYVWDNRVPAGTTLRSAFTGRIRYLVLESGPEHLRSWRSERRDVLADYLRLFGDEADTVPPLLGVGVGADADNTHGHGLAYVSDLTLAP